MNLYFKLKILLEYIIPAIIVFIIFVCFLFSAFKEMRVKNFFLNNGYKRELFDVPSVGDGAFYGWVRNSDGKRVDDRHIKGWSLKKIRAEYK